MPATPLPIAVARERAGVSVPELAAAIGINESWCWDLLAHEGELSSLSLRQFLRAASTLNVPPLSLLPEPVVPAREQRSLDELAQRITRFCSERKITTDQFSDLAAGTFRVCSFLVRQPSSTIGVLIVCATCVPLSACTGQIFFPTNISPPHSRSK